jgi:hypothetical protein
LREGIRLNIAVIILAGLHKNAVPLRRERNHIVDQPVLVHPPRIRGDTGSFDPDAILLDSVGGIAVTWPSVGCPGST